MVRISLVSVLVTLTLASVTPVAMALPGLGDAMKGVMPGAEKSADADGATQLSAADAQDSIVTEFREILRDVTFAQGALLTALGMKNQGDAAQADAKAMSGACDNKCIEEGIARSAELDKVIESAMSDADAMKAVSKEEAGKAIVPWLKAGLRTAQYIPKLGAWGKSATTEIKGAGLMGAAKMKKKFSQGLFIVSKAPGAAKKWFSTIKLAREVFKKNDISYEGANSFDF